LAQEFVIKSPQIEDKINQLLPSQGGFQAGVDFSASTMVVPVVNVTEAAEGSQLRQDLQSSLSLGSVTSFNIFSATTTTLINTTGYYRVYGGVSISRTAGANNQATFELTDGTTTKNIWAMRFGSAASTVNDTGFWTVDFIVKLEAGDSLTATSTGASCVIKGCTRQLADISGNLTNP
tara:strand:- start:47 stop:580 length:534 start_codon:yes stop_codon:yes gene_type:complete